MDNNRFPAIVVAKSAGARSATAGHVKAQHVMSEVKDELDPPFEILEPAEWRGPVVFNSPHSGSVYPRAFLTASRLEMATLRRSEDVNREPYELDPRMFDGRLPSFANTRSMRVAGGLGTVARVVGDAQEIY